MINASISSEAKTTTDSGRLENRAGGLEETANLESSSLAAAESAGFDEAAQSNTDKRYWESVIGSRLADYQIESHLGRGSMAHVYRARHLGLDRLCALKIIDPRLVSRHPAFRERFWAEARAAANLKHPHVVTIYNLGVDRGYDYIEMEYVPGAVSLREWLVRGGPFEPLRASKLVRQVVLASRPRIVRASCIAMSNPPTCS